MVLCCGGTSTKTSSSSKQPPLPPLENEVIEGGCYLTFDSNEFYYCWGKDEPEGTVIMFAKPDKVVPPGKLTGQQKHLLTATTDDKFLRGIIEFVREAAPYLPQITIREDADSHSLVAFMLVTHQPGNGVIGDRTVKVLPGKGSANIDGIDAIVAVPNTATSFDERNQTKEHFVEMCSKEGGVSLKLDPSGRTPPQVVY